jgi:polysaccharide biosynthesis/export protein
VQAFTITVDLFDMPKIPISYNGALPDTRVAEQAEKPGAGIRPPENIHRTTRGNGALMRKPHQSNEGFRLRMSLPWLAAVATVLAVWAWSPAGAQETPLRGDEKYVVKPGDTLSVSVWKEEDLQLEVLIRPDGGFSFPLAGDVLAAGRTVNEIAEVLSERLERYIPDTVVTVAVTAINGNKIYVIGQVNNPGAFVMNPRVDVMQALSMAGGTTAFAELNDIIILRRTAQGQTALKFRYGDVERGRNLEQNIMLESGDVVVVR